MSLSLLCRKSEKGFNKSETIIVQGYQRSIEAAALGMVVKTAVMGKEGSTDGDTFDLPATTLEYDLLR